MNDMEAMMLVEKEQLKIKIIDTLDTLDKSNFLNELKEIANPQIRELGSIHSFKIDIEIYKTVIYVYLDDKMSISYHY